jgi:hypothetical protein
VTPLGETTKQSNTTLIDLPLWAVTTADWTAVLVSELDRDIKRKDQGAPTFSEILFGKRRHDCGLVSTDLGGVFAVPPEEQHRGLSRQ